MRYVRWERQARLMHRAQEFLEASGLENPTRPVPLKLAIPLIQGASLEEDDQLQDRWAALLVNSANAEFQTEIRRSFVAILEQLTALDVRLLDILYALPFEQSQHAGIVTAELPVAAYLAEEHEHEFRQPSEDVVLSLSNLARLGCLRPETTMGGGEIYERVNPTISGRAFVQACRVPGA